MTSRENKSISFTPEQAIFIDACVASGRYQTVSEVVREGIRLLEQEEQQRLLEKWLIGNITDEQQQQLDSALLDRAKSHIQNLVAEGIRCGEERGWIDGEQAMQALRDRGDQHEQAG